MLYQKISRFYKIFCINMIDYAIETLEEYFYNFRESFMVQIELKKVVIPLEKEQLKLI